VLRVGSLEVLSSDPNAGGGGGGDPGEPFYGDDPADTLIVQDSFDYDSLNSGGDELFGSNGWDGANLADCAEMVPSSRGSNALRFNYGPACDDIVLEQAGFSAPHFFMQYWLKSSVGWDPSSHNTSGLKWLMVGHASGRYQWSLNRSAPQDAGCSNPSSWEHTKWNCNHQCLRDGGSGPCEISHYVWGADPCEPPPWKGSDPAAPGSPWRRITIELKSGSPGYQKAWIDGVLVFDDEGVGNTYNGVPDSWKVFGNTSNPEGPEAGSVDLDDVTLWQR
jgi:hypothetical protein